MFNYEEAFEVVKAKLDEQGIKHYTARPGNNCVWVSYGRINAYYIVKDDKVVDIIID